MTLELQKFISNFQKVTDSPTNYLSVDDDLVDRLKGHIKDIYDFTKKEHKNGSLKSLPKLIVKDFDSEQIWQQVNLQNEDVLNSSVTVISKLLSNKNKLVFGENIKKNEDAVDTQINSENDMSESDEDDEEEEGNKIEASEDDSDISVDKPKNTNTKSKRKSVVDDEFFKLDEMEAFLNKEENNGNANDSESDSENESDKESIDLFEENEDSGESTGEDDAKMAKFKDYFVKKDDTTEDKGKRKRGFSESNSDEEEHEEKIQLSKFELRQQRLRTKIEEMEEQAVSEKPWQLKGEIHADSRPQNSLLEEVVEFDITSRPAPVITENTSLQLEDIIRQRIKDKVFDSVERKEKPINSLLEYKKQLVLNQEKSKESLAQIYEKEFLDKQAALDPNNAEKEEEEPELHKEVRKMMGDLFNKLDALSNYHFTSRQSVPELKIVSNLPAINMEDVAPVAVSDAALLAPEEVRNKVKGDITGESERSKTDKNRERRKKKLKQKIHSKLKEKKEAAKKIVDGVPRKYGIKQKKIKKV